MAAVVAPKAGAALALVPELQRRGIDLLVLISSTSATLAPEGQAAYVATNSVLDMLAGHRGSLRIVTLNFGVWSGTGMATEAARRLRLGLGDGEPFDHPVLGEMSTDHQGRVVLSGRLSPGHHWVVDEHRASSGLRSPRHRAARAVHRGSARCRHRPGAAHRRRRDRTAHRARRSHGDGACRRRARRQWRSPHSDRQRPRPGRNLDDSQRGVTRQRGRPTRASSTCPGSTPAASSAASTPWAALAAHLHISGRWLTPVAARSGDGEVVGRIEAVGDDGELGWVAHPAVTDLATGCAISLTAPTVAGRLHVPIGYSAVRWWGNVPSPCVVHAVRQLANSSDELLRVDISIADTEGRVAMCIDGLQLRPVADDAVLGVVDEAPAAPAAAAPTRLLDVIEPLGLRADEATTWLDRAVASDLDRIVVTSVDLSSLAAFTSPAVPDRAEQPQQHSVGLGLEDSLAAIWQELLGVDEVAYDDDFFTLGGHSLIAIRMMTRIKNEFGVRFDLSTMFEASTVAALAERLRAERPGIDAELSGASVAHLGDVGVGEVRSAPRRRLVTISSQGDGRPLYVVHGAGGNVLFLSSLARALGGERPLLGFQAMGVDPDEIPDDSIEAMAARYIVRAPPTRTGPVPARWLLGRRHRGPGDGTPIAGRGRAGRSRDPVRQRAAGPGHPAAEHPVGSPRPARLPVRSGIGRAVRKAQHLGVAAPGHPRAWGAPARAQQAGSRARLRRRRRRLRQPLLLLLGCCRSVRARVSSMST